MGTEITGEIQAVWEEYLDFFKSGVSKQGYKNMACRTRRLVTWFTSQDLDVREIGIREAIEYQTWITERTTAAGGPCAGATISNDIDTARKFFTYLVDTGYRKTNPFLALSYPRFGDHLTRNILTQAQMGRLLRELGRFDELPGIYDRLRRYRVHVIAEFLYASGLRIAEACSLTEADLDLRGRTVRVTQGKGGTSRTAFLTSYACQVLEGYLKEGRNLLLHYHERKHPQRLFLAEERRVAMMVNHELKTVCKALELPVITTHGFRHSLGTHLLQSGADMRHIQVILGHECLGTTQIYTRVTKDDLKKSLDEFHPRQWRKHES